jgi:hypothetical protein
LVDYAHYHLLQRQLDESAQNRKKGEKKKFIRYRVAEMQAIASVGRQINNAVNGVWHGLIGKRLIQANIAAKVPTKDLDAFIVAEKEVMDDVAKRVLPLGIDMTKNVANATPQQQIAIVKAFNEAQAAHPTFKVLAGQLEHHKWHAMHKAPAAYVNFFTRETVYSLVIALGMGCVILLHFPSQHCLGAMYNGLMSYKKF